MANAPFRDDPEQSGDYDNESHPIKNVSANSFFTRTIKVLTVIISLVSIGLIALLIVSYIFLHTGPFTAGWRVRDSQGAIRDLAIILLVNFFLSAPTIFIQLPIIITLAKDIAFSVVALVFSSRILSRGWPDDLCYRWDPTPLPGERYGHQVPGTESCLNAQHKVRVFMGIAGGCGILVGCLILTTLFLRVIAIYKTLVLSRFWEGKKNIFAGTGWKPRGFTVQFTLSILPGQETTPTATGGEQDRLIET